MPIENPNATVMRNWGLSEPIKLDEVSAEDAAVLESADKNGDGMVTAKEARDRIVVNSRVLRDAATQAFKAVVEKLTFERAGVRVDLSRERPDALSHILYIQLNNATDVVLREEKDLRNFIKQDPDRPSLDKINLTAQFNTEGDEESATAAFKGALSAYFDRLIANGQRMSGFIISGHSNGTAMLQEGEHHNYYSNLYPRTVLQELRDENPKYAQLLDGCEKVAALACFHGYSVDEWQEVAPNATIAGTQGFAPLATSHKSATIYGMAAAAHQVMEDGGTADQAQAAAAAVPYAAGLNDPVAQLPASRQERIARARQALAQARASYAYSAEEIVAVRRNGGAGVEQYALDRYYSVANELFLRLRALWTAEGQPAGERAREVATAEFERNDLFAIRKHLPRPVA